MIFLFVVAVTLKKKSYHLLLSFKTILTDVPSSLIVHLKVSLQNNFKLTLCRRFAQNNRQGGEDHNNNEFTHNFRAGFFPGTH